ncbi:MAG: ABC transporter permease subunit [Thermoplasmata archaeon]|nr:MAG: ABC transporter permease subunit [Thermoplasmata archaeon]
MGIHDLGYRVFKGQIGGRLDRIWAIFIQDFTFRFKQPATIALIVLNYVIALMPMIVLTYFVRIIDFSFYYSWSFIWIVIYTAVIGSPIISNDMKNNAVILYFSRPLTKEDYFIGKFLTLFVLISFVTFVPALIYSTIILGTATESMKETINITQVVITLNVVGLLIAMVFSAITILISSMTKRYLYAGVGIFTVLFFSDIMGIILREIISKNMGLISIWDNLYIIADDWGGFNAWTDFSWSVSLAIIFAITLLSLAGAWRIIRRIEVI